MEIDPLEKFFLGTTNPLKNLSALLYEGDRTGVLRNPSDDRALAVKSFGEMTELEVSRLNRFFKACSDITVEEIKHQGIAAENPNLEAFKREDAAFRRKLPELLGKWHGQFVAMKGGQVVDRDGKKGALATRMAQTYKGQFVLIRQVTEKSDAANSPEPPEVG
jgi:hypothetical protein